MMKRRECGVLLPVASLPSEYGIGSFSKEAYAFVDRLAQAGQRYWQILPLGPTGYGDSPYQSFSAFAGNPYFIDLEQLIEEGLLTEAECRAVDFGSDPSNIDYEKIYRGRFPLLRKAYERWKKAETADGQHEKLLDQALSDETKEYCFYMAVKDSFGGKSWAKWDTDIRIREEKAVRRYREEMKDDIRFYEFLQFQFQKQWKKLKTYANQAGIRMIGDIPIYVAFDSADSWAHPELFQFDEEGCPEAVAGCPPDAFSVTGQLWGNPLYRWDYHRETGYAWWMARMEYSFGLYDVVRIDHFRGFDAYYSIPAADETAEFGHWEEGPGYGFFQALKERFDDVDIIAEDLGFLTPSVRELLKQTGFPGMKVLEFAFDETGESDYLPHRYTSTNCVVYTGTHDNMTLRGWYEDLSEKARAFALDYMGNENTPKDRIHWDYIRLALASTARLVVIPVQDYLGLGNEARINEPSTLGKNWRWRMGADDLTEELVETCRHLARLYGR
ncbi:MAG: 4-alpha-glucanotransferase [Clostridiales bacterium]|nr:4-alpha-glucanotransferase [Clostridiales bacterium]